MAAEIRIPLGQGKGTIEVKQADDELLRDFVNWYDGPNCAPKFRDKYKLAVDACRAEIIERSKPHDAPRDEPPQKATADEPMTNALAALPTTHNPLMINERFAKLREEYHLVSPATQVDALPEGFGVSVAFIAVDPNPEKNGPGDVYSVGAGKVGIAGHIIQQFGAAAAIDWDAELSKRLDNARDQRYVHFRAVGWLKNLDGTPRMTTGEVEIDAREGSDLVNEIREKARVKRLKYPKDYNDDGVSEIAGIRKFILRAAESKAQNRATMKGLGIKRAYKPDELKKPFAIARLSFTGHTTDPELKRDFAKMNAAAALQGRRQLYNAPPTPQLPEARPEPEGHEPPPVGSVGDDDDDGGFGAPPPRQREPEPEREPRPRRQRAAARDAEPEQEPQREPEAKPEGKPERQPDPEDDGRG